MQASTPQARLLTHSSRVPDHPLAGDTERLAGRVTSAEVVEARRMDRRASRSRCSSYTDVSVLSTPRAMLAGRTEDEILPHSMPPISLTSTRTALFPFAVSLSFVCKSTRMVCNRSH